MRWFAVIVLLSAGLFVVPARGQDAATAPSVGPDSIEADLAALADPQFNVREEAARRLVLRKIDSVAPLTQRALNGNAEASVRAFDILRQLYRDGDDATCTAIESAFESLLASENVTVAARAESAISSVAQVWHRRAVENFVKLGGKIRYSDVSTKDDAADTEKENKADKLARPIEYAIISKSWTGGNDGLKYLQRIDDFRAPAELHKPAALFVIEEAIDQEAIAALEAALPNLHVQQRGPACLGVTPGIQRDPEGLLVQDVKPKSAAAVAGIQVGDTITKFNGIEVNDFDTLVKKIAEKQPSDKVPVVLRRNGVEKKLTVELHGWE